MKREKIKEILEKNKSDWNELALGFSQTRRNLWFEFEDFKPYTKEGDKILDLGCGNGRLYELFKNKNIEYIGIDQSEELIEIARLNSKFQIPNSKQSFIVGDALNLKNKFSQNEFDVVFSIAVLHHLPSREIQLKVIKDCYNFLKPGGYFICTVWNLWQPRLIKKYKIWKILFGFRNVFISFKSRDNHSVVVKRYHYIFTRRELIKLFKKSGFKIIDSYYTRKGKKSNQFKGYNLTLIAQK